MAFNGSGRAPRAADPAWFADNGFETMPTFGPHAVTIPGAIDAWCRLIEDHGSKDLAEIFAAAVHYAENGYVVHDRVAFDWALAAERLSDDPNAAKIFLSEGQALKAGDVHRQPALAETLRIIAKQGRAGFYEGAIAADLVGHLNSLGGLHTLEDFAEATGNYETPISSRYRDHDIWQLPPANQGVTALIGLNILGGYDLSAMDPLGADRLHLELEAGRLAYGMRDLHVSDPASAKITPEELLSAATADRLRGRISPDRAMPTGPLHLEASDTVYLSVVDRDRNVVSFINSTYYSFGSGLVGPRSGVVLQNRGACFRLDPNHPNCIAGGKRPLHTIMPGMVTRDGRAVMSYGVMGGDYQPMGHMHVLSNVLDFGMDIQEAIDQPRIFFDDDKVVAERGIPETTLARLAARGHITESTAEPLGGGQAIVIDWDKGTLTGGSDPRKDGCALGL